MVVKCRKTKGRFCVAQFISGSSPNKHTLLVCLMESKVDSK